MQKTPGFQQTAPDLSLTRTLGHTPLLDQSLDCDWLRLATSLLGLGQPVPQRSRGLCPPMKQ